MKSIIQDDHIPINKFQLSAIGVTPDLVFTAISGIEEELNTTELPDKTMASGGRTGVIEFTAELPLHHVLEQAAMETWFAESHGTGRNPDIAAGGASGDLPYRKTGTLRMISLSGTIEATWQIDKLFPTKRGMPELEMDNEGEMAVVEWSFAASSVLKI